MRSQLSLSKKFSRSNTKGKESAVEIVEFQDSTEFQTAKGNEVEAMVTGKQELKQE